MRTIFLFFLFGIFQSVFVYGQTTVGNVNAKPKIIVDTIPPLSPIFVGTNVSSFTVTYIYNGICLTRKINGPFLPEGSRGLKKGDRIILDDIISIDASGKQIKLPAKEYVIR